MKRGRKSEAELVSLAVVRPRLPDDRQRPAHDRPEPPAHLSAEAKAWWNRVVASYDIAEHALPTLQATAEAWDRKEEARKALAEHGLTYSDAHDVIRPRPEAAIERNALTMFLRGLRELNLKIEPPKGHGLSPAALFDPR